MYFDDRRSRDRHRWRRAGVILSWSRRPLDSARQELAGVIPERTDSGASLVHLHNTQSIHCHRRCQAIVILLSISAPTKAAGRREFAVYIPERSKARARLVYFNHGVAADGDRGSISVGILGGDGPGHSAALYLAGAIPERA